MRYLENTPQHLRDDPRYAEDKAVRDKAWEDFRRDSGLRTAFPPAMQQVIDEGYAARLSTGDTRAAMLFARLVAYRLNPSGSPTLPGALRKGGGHNVDGYSTDAIVMNANPADLFNVYDLVVGVEAPGAHPSWNGPLPRRSSDTWEAPRALTNAELTYLRGGVTPPPVDPSKPEPPKPPEKPMVPYQPYVGDEFWTPFGQQLERDYHRAGQVLNAGSAVWFARTIWDATMGEAPGKILTLEESVKKHRKEWCAALGVPVD